MKKYKVIITEEYSDIWDVGADSPEEAKKLASKLAYEYNRDNGRNPDDIKIYSVEEVSDNTDTEDFYTELPAYDDRGVRRW